MKTVDKNQLKLKELEKFEMIVKQQKKNVYDVLDDFIIRYNEKHKEDYEKAIQSFWET